MIHLQKLVHLFSNEFIFVLVEVVAFLLYQMDIPQNVQTMLHYIWIHTY